MIKLSQSEFDELSEIVVSSAESYILSRVSKKEIIDIDINVELIYKGELSVDITVNIIFDDLSSADPEVADEAADYAIFELEKRLK